jgi:hypothetical protein
LLLESRLFSVVRAHFPRSIIRVGNVKDGPLRRGKNTLDILPSLNTNLGKLLKGEKEK